MESVSVPSHPEAVPGSGSRSAPRANQQRVAEGRGSHLPLDEKGQLPLPDTARPSRQPAGGRLLRPLSGAAELATQSSLPVHADPPLDRGGGLLHTPEPVGGSRRGTAGPAEAGR